MDDAKQIVRRVEAARQDRTRHQPWIDETLRLALPIIERVAWILARRGVLPEVKLKGGKVVNVRPISPLSKAKDLEDMNLTGQVLQFAAGIGAALQVGVPIDATATMDNLIATAKERHIVMKTPEQLAQEAAMAAMSQGGMPDAAA